MTLAAVLIAGLAAGGFARPAQAEARPGADCATSEAHCFVLTSLTIDGVSAYPLHELAPLYADYLARPVSQADLVRIAQAITDKYRADGYFLSRAVVPPQGPEPGQARLRVYEGYIGEVTVTGRAAPSVKLMLRGLTAQRPLKLAALERRMMLASDLPGVRLRSNIEPILDDPARHRLVIKTELQRTTASLYVDNRGTQALGPDQAYGRLALNSLVRPGDQLAFAVLSVPSDPRALVYGEASYGAALANDAWVKVTASSSHSRLGVSAFDQSLGANSKALNLRLAYPLKRGRKTSLWTAVAFDARHVEQVYPNGGAYADDLRVLRASLSGSEASQAGSSNLFVQASRGLGAFGASDAKGPRRSRLDADARFWKLNAGLSHYRDIGRYAGVYLSADAQWAPQPLLLSEQFAPGGAPYGRAYNYAEISGDSGVAALAEFRVGWDPKLAPLTFVQTYAFADAAKVWNHAPSFAPLRADLASAGLGLRLTFRDRVSFKVEAARPLGPAPWETHSHDWRVFASLSAGF